MIDPTVALQAVTLVLIGLVQWNVNRVFKTLDNLVDDVHQAETDIAVIKARLHMARSDDEQIVRQ